MNAFKMDKVLKGCARVLKFRPIWSHCPSETDYRIFAHGHCDQFGRFLKFLVRYVIAKVAQIFPHFLACFEKPCFLSKSCYGYSLATLGKITSFYTNIWSHCSLGTLYFLTKKLEAIKCAPSLCSRNWKAISATPRIVCFLLCNICDFACFATQISKQIV